MLFRRYAYYISSIVSLLTGFRNPLKIVGIFLGENKSKEAIVQLRKSDLKFIVRGKMDIWSLKETLLDRFYERFGFAIQDGWTVVDIGGGIGDYTIFAAFGRNQATVMVFEPFAESYRLLQQNLTLNQMQNVQPFPQAVASRTGLLQFAGGMVDPLSRQTTYPSRELTEKSIAVEAVSLESIVDHIPSRHIDLIKLDCEGAEYDIVMNSSSTVLANIDRIVLEYHDGVTPFTHHELADHLTKNGFQVESWKNYAHDNIGYLRAQRIAGSVGI